MENCPYKDSTPEKTIEKIRNILLENKILTIEKHWLNNLNKFYSCRVETSKTGLGTNGKGLTEEYALASAYGEFMERIQNHLLFPRVEFSREDQMMYGFRVEPTEKRMLINDAEELPEAFKKSKPFNDEESLFDFWKNCTGNTRNNYEIVLTPYYNIKEDGIVNLPFHFMQSIYRSNGMCAGNSPEEAMVQGFSEIFERYVMSYIYFNEITPPSIEHSYLKDYYPKQYNLIKLIESFDKYKIIVKDCSLGMNIPVIAIIFVDLKTNSCAIKFGADPEQGIALERCLTELLQGASITQVNKLTSIKLSEFNILEDPDNFRTMMTIGKGRFANAFFSDTPSYNFKGMNGKAYRSFKDKLYFSIDVTNSLGFDDIYIKDNSFLGINAYQIIVPGFSEAFVIQDERKKLLQDPVRHIHSISNLDKLPDNELMKLASDMDTYRAAQDQKNFFPLLSYFSIPNDGQKEWNKLTLEFMLAIIYYKLGDYKKAYSNISMYIEFIKRNFPQVNLEYHYCIREYFALSAQNYDRKKIKNILLPLFSNSIVDSVFDDLKDKSKLFQYIPLPTCWNCDKCFLKGSCHYDNMRDLYLKLKEIYKNNPVDQLKLAVVFKGRKKENILQAVS